MARGREEHQARLAAVARLGRNLSRRASNRCELCEERTSLSVVEVEPLPDEPDEDAAVMACERCARAMASGRNAPDPAELRALEATAWSEHAPVQVAAVRVLRRLQGDGVAWASELLDGLYLSDEVGARLGD